MAFPKPIYGESYDSVFRHAELFYNAYEKQKVKTEEARDLAVSLGRDKQRLERVLEEARLALESADLLIHGSLAPNIKFQVRNALASIADLNTIKTAAEDIPLELP